MQFAARLGVVQSMVQDGLGQRQFIAIGLCIVVAWTCMGCSQDSRQTREEDGDQPMLLSELIQVRLPHRLGDDTDGRVRFHDRRTGRKVAVDSLYVPSETSVLVVAAEFSEGLLVACRSHDGLHGYVGCSGQILIPFRFAAAEPFREGRALVALPGRDGMPGPWGLIDRRGRWVVPPGRHDQLGPFREGRCGFRKGELWGVLNAAGEVVVPPRYREVPVFHSHLAVVKTQDGKTAYIDPNGNVQVKPPEDALMSGDFNYGVAWFAVSQEEDGNGLPEVFLHHRYGLFSVAGRTIAPPIYSGMGEFSEGLAAVSKLAAEAHNDDSEPVRLRWDNEKGPWGYVDVAGKVVIPMKFGRAGRFSDGLARVCQNGKWGYIDKSGQIVIPCRFVWARDFRCGLAEVWDKDSIKVIDRTGKVVLDTGLEPVTF